MSISGMSNSTFTQHQPSATNSPSNTQKFAEDLQSGNLVPAQPGASFPSTGDVPRDPTPPLTFPPISTVGGHHPLPPVVSPPVSTLGGGHHPAPPVFAPPLTTVGSEYHTEPLAVASPLSLEA